MAVKKRTKSINDLRAQMERIQKGLFKGFGEARSSRYGRAVSAYNRMTRNIRNTKEGESVRAQNRADNEQINLLSRTVDNGRAVQAVIKRNTAMNDAFENKQMSYSARMGITG